MPAHMTSGRGVNLLNYKWKTMPKVEYSTQQINEGTHSGGQANPLGKSSEALYREAEAAALCRASAPLNYLLAQLLTKQKTIIMHEREKS